MRTARRLVAVLLVGATFVLGGCGGGDDPVVDDSNLSTTSTALRAGTPCEVVRQDLERLRQTLGVPDGIEELKQMLADALDEIETAVRHAGDLAGEAARPVQAELGQAAANAGGALTAVAEGNFGVAREELGQASHSVRRAWEALAAACGEPGPE